MTTKFNIESTLPLPNTTLTIPRLGFGVFQSHGPTCIQSCLTAIKAGYKKIDSAQYYANEELVNQAVAASGVPREQLFLTTKQLFPSGDVDQTYAKVVQSVKNLGGESGYVDLFLIHSPSSGTGGRKTLWQALERAHQEGKCKAIGVSNFGIGHIEELKSFAKIWPPHVNQIEVCLVESNICFACVANEIEKLHPWCQQRDVVEYCNKNSIIVEAYCPLVRGMKNDDPVLQSIAKKHQKDPGQVLVRYCLQKNWSPLPKSDTPNRIKGNADLFDFNLDAGDMDKLDGCDEGPKGCIVEAVTN